MLRFAANRGYLPDELSIQGEIAATTKAPGNTGDDRVAALDVDLSSGPAVSAGAADSTGDRGYALSRRWNWRREWMLCIAALAEQLAIQCLPAQLRRFAQGTGKQR